MDIPYNIRKEPKSIPLQDIEHTMVAPGQGIVGILRGRETRYSLPTTPERESDPYDITAKPKIEVHLPNNLK